MEPLAIASELVSQGKFGDALRALGDSHNERHPKPSADILRAELYERLGQYGQSMALAERLLRSKGLSLQGRAACEFTIARILLDEGDTEGALRRFQRSASLAAEGGDLERLCWSQIRLLTTLAERTAPEVTGSLLSDVRSNAVRSGNPQLLAAVHLYVGEMDAKRGLLTSGQRHTLLGLDLVAFSPNVWLGAVAENTLLAIAVMRNDFDSGLVHGDRAVDLAIQSGAAATLRACLGNFGNLHLMIGNFEQAISYFERAIAALPSRGHSTNANLDSLAKIRLVQGRYADCDVLLKRIGDSIQTPTDLLLYPNRYAQLTKAQLAVREKRWDEALVAAASIADLALKTEDSILRKLAALTEAEIYCETGRFSECLRSLESITHSISGQEPEIHAYYERILGCATVAHDQHIARHHFERSKRICDGTRNVPGTLELDRYRQVGQPAPPIKDPILQSLDIARHVTQTVVTLIMHAGRPELQARELVQLLDVTDCVQNAAAISRSTDDRTELLSDLRGGFPDIHPGPSPELRQLSIGSTSGRSYQVAVTPRSDIESMATLNAITVLLDTLRDLERARADREERATLWPAEELPSQDGDAVTTGHMRELMGLARRMGPTNVTVLITGESGTGKEILARALHTFSTRSAKPFVPFNCASIPREMLESQLFGHRRGAFTGADRDHPGVIRAARDGTLFLDEIGDMSLDLQPKLLRFLESGEISPLGESGPVTVNVRVVAATNARLETLVADGRFRDDLYYRLNVFRLSIRPLRERRDEIPSLVNTFVTRAAAEFHKGLIGVAEETMEHLILYPWPGNVRQLLNEIRRMVALAEPHATLAPRHISSEIRATLPAFPTVNAASRDIQVPLRDKLTPTLSRIESEMIKAALRDNGGKVDATAKALGISRKGLYLKRQRLGL